jgi:hypothetical protein
VRVAQAEQQWTELCLGNISQYRMFI